MELPIGSHEQHIMDPVTVGENVQLDGSEEVGEESNVQ